jgi:hypothetical protein
MHVQPDAEPELVFFSQRQGTQLEQYATKFTYDDSAGEGVTCYILDDGADDTIPVLEYCHSFDREHLLTDT